MQTEPVPPWAGLAAGVASDEEIIGRVPGGFYHDGRFPTLAAVVQHYDRLFNLRLTDTEINDLVEYLKSL